MPIKSCLFEISLSTTMHSLCTLIRFRAKQFVKPKTTRSIIEDVAELD
jgi:hypothetical protein